MRKIKHYINKTFYYFCIFYFITFLGIIAYFYYAINTIESREIEVIKETKSTLIYDSSNRLIEDFNQDIDNNVKYEDLPSHLINALISIEDRNFFKHSGIDYSSILRSLINNISSSTRQGGSTITQQLVKNLLLSSDISYKRKIQEAYLATSLEQIYTKEQLLELYFNRIYFDATTPGIKYAAYRFFNKDVSLLNLAECALLVGLVKSPSYYSPFKYIEKANERKNIVLKCMLEENYITINEYNNACSIHASNFVIDKGSNYKEKTYDFQAYLDIVYSEVERITGYSPFSKPMKIVTYLDTSLQHYLDNIEANKIINFSDDITQIAASVIDNNTGGIIGVIGGRNYNGMRLYNRAYNMLRQPASTMKPIFTYALAMEYLNYNEYTLVEDKPYTYPNTNISIHNADKKYLGDISLTDAIGYSRNTSTLYTLEKVINKIGLEKTINYLKSINLMDNGTFSYPYAIGGMTYGISPINLCGAYSLLPRNGIYIKPSVIKSITFLDDNIEVYNHSNVDKKKVLSSEASYLINSTLENIRKQNHLNINYAFPSNIDCVGKTGTNAYDEKIIKQYNYPSNADRDSWFAGYSKNYTVVTWSGFDEPKIDEKTYFGYNDERRKYPKDMFKKIISFLEIDNQKLLNIPNTMTQQDVVILKDKIYLPNDFVPKSLIKKITIKKSDMINEILPYPVFKELTPISALNMQDEIFLSMPELENDMYEPILGNKIYIVEYNDVDNNSYIKDFEVDEFMIPIYNDIYEIKIKETYKKNTSISSEPFTISSYY